MSEKPLNILISGAGVAGAALALCLARQPNMKCKPIITLLERTPATRSTGQAIDIRGPGVDVIRKLGLEPEIKSRHTTETGFAFLDAKGGVISKTDATGDAKRQNITSEYEILRSDLVDLLLSGVNEAKASGASVNLVYNESISTLDNTPSGVHVQFTNNKLPPSTYDIVLGADGSGSKVRSLIFGKEPTFKKPSGMYCAFYTIPRIPEDESLYKMAILPGGLSMHLRPHMSGNTMGCYLAIVNPAGSSAEMDAVLKQDIPTQKAFFQKRFEGTGWQDKRFTDELMASEDFYATHWCQVRTPQYIQNRVGLLGDAGFATMGIGTSFALTSAYIISGELSKIDSPEQVSQALASYEAIFKPYVDKNTWTFSGLRTLFPQSKWAIWVVHWIVRVVVASRILTLLGWLFGGEDRENWDVPEYGWEEKKVV